MADIDLIKDMTDHELYQAYHEALSSEGQHRALIEAAVIKSLHRIEQLLSTLIQATVAKGK